MADWQEQATRSCGSSSSRRSAPRSTFVDRLAEAAESENHHPDIDIRYRRVTVRWTTHSEGGITERDREMAERTSALTAA